ncbi:hypothetical protein OCV73_00215 [Barnesiella propionica]|nr:hypothetical protein [Barnesiella propionica]
MDDNKLIIKQENVAIIVQSAPQAYEDNLISHDRCLNACRELLDAINQKGMNGDLDQQAAFFIERAKKTVRKMNEKRSPCTKLFDEIRATFTAMENDVDPSKKDSLPYKLQQYRNAYAAKKLEEAERKRREEERRVRIEIACNTYRLNCEEDYKQSFNRTLNAAINEMMSYNNSITLDNYEAQKQAIEQFNVLLSDDWIQNVTSSVILPAELSADELRSIRQSVLNELFPKFKEQYKFEMESNRDDYLDRLPSKKRELETIAKKTAEEAEKLKAELVAREAQEAGRREAERKQKAEQERLEVQMKKQTVEMDGLFGVAQTSILQYQPKTSVKNKIIPLDIDAFPEIFMMWWTHEGITLSVEELSKIFKKQIMFCEKLANDKNSPVHIKSEHIYYGNEVKAK